MISLQKMLGKEDRFFDLLEASAQQACSSVKALSAFLQAPDEKKTLDGLIEARRKEKRIASELSEELCRSFVTAMEREDIEALSVSLYKIPKTVEKIGERILLAPKLIHGVEMGRQLSLLEQAAAILLALVQELRRDANLSVI